MSAAVYERLAGGLGSSWQAAGSEGALERGAFLAGVDRLAERLARVGVTRIASRMDNSPHWLMLDLAVLRLGGTHVPLPTFFSAEQVAHALASSGAQVLATDVAAPRPNEVGAALAHRDGDTVSLWSLAAPSAPAILPAETACITYTSGTTARAKGVCLSATSLADVAGSLVNASRALAPRRHLCLMPLSTLLENVAGLHATLLSGADIAVPPLAQIGYTGASGLDVPTLIACLHRYRPHSAILLPQLLLALVSVVEAGARLPDSLRYLAVGGGRVGPRLLARASALGLPVYEGYGLTECASVVCLNRPDAIRSGSVGRALTHARVSIDDGEICVDGVRALGYLGDETLPPGPIRTGDLGHIDADGFVHVTGRRKNVFITAFGRNVSPEWVESELVQHPAIAQAVVWGEARADNVALLWPRRPDLSDAALAAAVSEVNQGLPDYAQVTRTVRLPRPLSAADGLLTANGRLRREQALARYQAEIDLSYRRPPQILPAGVRS